MKKGSLTILAKSNRNHLIGWLRRPMRWAFQSNDVAIGFSILQNCHRAN